MEELISGQALLKGVSVDFGVAPSPSEPSPYKFFIFFFLQMEVHDISLKMLGLVFSILTPKGLKTVDENAYSFSRKILQSLPLIDF